MSLDAIANTDLAYDTEVFRACAKTYGQTAEDLRPGCCSLHRLNARPHQRKQKT